MGWHPMMAVLIGAAVGYGWHRVVGCSSGACPITANPYTATLYGALMGYLAARGG